MKDEIARLLRLSSASIAESSSLGLFTHDVFARPLGRELAGLLAQRNGFYAFESALLVRPRTFSGCPLGLAQWNDGSLWRHAFEADFSDVLFFAEDIFGTQFCIHRDEISSFDPETGEFYPITKTLRGWAGWIVDDYRVRKGWPLAREWQLHYGAIEPGQRLLPKRPFVLGGELTLGNLYKLNEVEGMLFRASIAIQLRDCPNGSTVILRPTSETDLRMRWAGPKGSGQIDDHVRPKEDSSTD
jgi:hypothetical protein